MGRGGGGGGRGAARGAARGGSARVDRGLVDEDVVRAVAGGDKAIWGRAA
jgi:hypothetical protein